MTCDKVGKIQTFEPEAEIDLSVVSREIDATEKKLAEVQGRIKGYLKEIGLDGQEADRA